MLQQIIVYLIINTLTTILRRVFILHVLKALEDAIRRLAAFPFYLTREKNVFSLLRNLFIQGKGTCLIVKKETKFCNKLSKQINLLVEFHREKCNLYYKSHKNT